MLKVLAVVDKIGTALDRLAKGVAPYHKNLDYRIIDVHPKRPSPEQLQRFESEARDADIIEAQYYRTMDMLREKYTWAKEIPTLLVHNNPYAIHERDWNDYQAVIGSNKEIYEKLQKITVSRVEHISLAVDPYFWRFNDDYKYEKSVIMVANRIEAKKGILPVAEACKKMRIKMYLVGAISDPEYWRKVMDTGIVQFAQEISDEELRGLYYRAGIHVCNSVDNFESGTLPVLEAIFCGVPVLSRLVGHVPEFKEGITVQDGNPENVERIADVLDEMLNDKHTLDVKRNEAWFMIKDKNFKRRAYKYQKLYRELLGGTPASVIIPVAGREEVTRAALNAIANQTHQNIEIIVIDDGESGQQESIAKFAETVTMSVRYIRLDGKGYNLAKARNLGIIEATSDVLIFCDQRIIMQPDAVEVFLNNIKPKYWLYGSKGVKKEFVENFSCVYRDDITTMGMFNERIEQYGGMSQEIRARARRQQIILHYLEEAKASPYGKSSNRRRRKYEIMESKNLLWKIGMH